MKKILAIALLLFMTFMSYVLVGGFIQKQSKEATIESKNSVASQKISTPAVLGSYAMSEVAQHSTSKDCWLVINAKVYNVSSFMREHPGGASTIIPYCGKEATKAFDTQDRGPRAGHSPQASQMLGDYLIGRVKTN